MKQAEAKHDWDGRTSAQISSLTQTDDVFESLFERSADAIWLYDPESAMLVDCNEAAVKLIGAENKEQLLPARPEDLSPQIQGDGLSSAEKSVEVVAAVKKENTHRFEWLIRKRDAAVAGAPVASGTS